MTRNKFKKVKEKKSVCATIDFIEIINRRAIFALTITAKQRREREFCVIQSKCYQVNSDRFASVFSGNRWSNNREIVKEKDTCYEFHDAYDISLFKSLTPNHAYELQQQHSIHARQVTGECLNSI